MILVASVAVVFAAQAVGIIDFGSSMPVQAWLVMGLATLSGDWMAFNGGSCECKIGELHKLAQYMTKDNLLLVFTHARHAEVGIQVPAGSSYAPNHPKKLLCGRRVRKPD